ncbi:hypothetical protein AB4271_16650 [Vibrio splendidus]
MRLLQTGYFPMSLRQIKASYKLTVRFSLSLSIGGQQWTIDQNG